jgi:hypothetical protein
MDWCDLLRLAWAMLLLASSACTLVLLVAMLWDFLD